MTQELMVQALLGAGVLVLAWRAVDGFLKVAGRRARRGKETEAMVKRVEALENELTRFPRDVPNAEDVEALAARVAGIVDGVARNGATVGAEMVALREKLITREMAERIVTQVNKVTLEVEALKEWQSTVSNTSELASVLGLEPSPEKTSAS